MSQRFELEQADGSEEIVLHPSEVEVETSRGGALPRRPHLAPIWDAVREQALDFVGAAMDVASVVQSFRDANPGKGDTEIFARIVLPKEAQDLVLRGEWTMPDAVDGRGKLPWVADETGTIKHQVRLQDIQHGSAGADSAPVRGLVAGQALTHLQLRRIAATLERVEAKVDDVLLNDKFDWWSAIEAGIEEMLGEPGWSSDAPFMAVLRGSMAKAVKRGWHHIDRTAKRLASVPMLDWKEAFRAANEKRMPSLSSTRRAMMLDELRADLVVIVRGTEALVAIDEANDNSERGAQRVAELHRRLGEIAEIVAGVHRLADYDPQREEFWDKAMPALGEALPYEPPQISVVADVATLAELAGLPEREPVAAEEGR